MWDYYPGYLDIYSLWTTVASNKDVYKETKYAFVLSWHTFSTSEIIYILNLVVQVLSIMSNELHFK